MILGFYGSSNIELGPNSSRLLDANPFFVQSIKVSCWMLFYYSCCFLWCKTQEFELVYVQVKELHESKHRPVLYGFDELPPLDVKITWSETHFVFVEPGNHRVKFLWLPLGS